MEIPRWLAYVGRDEPMGGEKKKTLSFKACSVDIWVVRWLGRWCTQVTCAFMPCLICVLNDYNVIKLGLLRQLVPSDLHSVVSCRPDCQATPVTEIRVKPRCFLMLCQSPLSACQFFTEAWYDLTSWTPHCSFQVRCITLHVTGSDAFQVSLMLNVTKFSF